MSHFTTVQTLLEDRDTVLSALDDLGIPHDDLPARGWNGREAQCEFRAVIPPYDLGFRRGERGYQIVAELTAELRAVVQRLTRTYARHMALRTLESQGFELIEETVREDGRLHMLVRRAG